MIYLETRWLVIVQYKDKNNYIDEDESWSGILAAADFAVRSTYHIT